VKTDPTRGLSHMLVTNSSHCSCGREMVVITMNTPTAPVQMRSCSVCDRVDWFVGTAQRDKTAALDQLATTGRR
jgi:hypothetical protein